MAPEVMAVLERLTDPTEQAIAEAITAMAELRSFFHRLKTATGEDDKDCLDLLEAYVYEADEALDHLIEAIEETR